MGLDIIVKPHYKDYVITDKRTITYNDFEEMTAPNKDDFAYVDHPDQFLKDEKLYDKIQSWFDDQDAGEPSIHFTYWQFFVIRNLILRDAGLYYVNNQTDKIINSILPDTMDYSWQWDEDTIKSSQSKQAISFFTAHSDCDDDYPAEEVNNLNHLLHEYPLSEESKQFLSKKDLLNKYNEFVAFINKAAKDKETLLFC